MIKVAICKLIMKIAGWKVDNGLPEEVRKKCLVLAAPHTSNWDLLYTVCAFSIIGIDMRYLIKKEIMDKPIVGAFLRALGGIAVDRSPRKEGEERKSMVDATIDVFNKYDRMVIVIAPEGTRSLRTKWKTGFYNIAKGANVPISLGYLDYKNKIAGIKRAIQPSDYEKDMREITAFYKDIHPKYPELFSVDKEFL